MLNKLRGYTFVKGILSKPDEWGVSYYGIELQKNEDVKIVWLLMDEEGNGPGFPEIQSVNI
jgi:hypothetical protein